ncbi:TPA: hypothetical protein ACP32N_005063 [Pseudomonas aeruginosa]
MTKLKPNDLEALDGAKARAEELVEALTKLVSAQNDLLGLHALDLQQDAISISKKLGLIRASTGK